MAAAAGLMGPVVSKLSELLKEEYNLPTGSKEELKSMATQLRRLQAWYCNLTDAPPDEVGSAGMDMLDRIRELFCQAENFVDYSLATADCPKPAAANRDGFRRLFKKTRDSSHLPHPTAEMNLKTLTQRALLMVEELVQGVRPQCLYKDEKHTELVGIHGPRDVLIKMLADEDGIMSNKEVKIVSIVGSRGIGKTTLAQVVYHQVKPQFDCGAFVRPPLEPGMGGFFKELSCQLGVQNHIKINEEGEDETLLISQIGEFLQNKRYLVVIDDLWNEEDWHNIACTLPNNDYGSRVMTTTRVNDIAKLCCSSSDESIHEMKHLGYLDSKELFLKRSFGCEISFPNALTDVFNVILKMCGGTPSAIISIASFLATKVTTTMPWQELMISVYSAWKPMPSSLDSGPQNIPGFEELRQILSLTYHHLPSSLKACLLYSALHAKRQMIHKNSMVKKWIAEGFISGYVGFIRDEVASQYFAELVDRNFIQLVEYGNYIGEEIYEINYMVLYVLRLIAQYEDFATVFSDAGLSLENLECFRLSIQCSGSELSVHIREMNQHRIRSITIVGPANFYLNDSLVFLRMLDLNGCKYLDNSDMVHICGMILLKYLSLKHTQVSKIPPEIGKLQELETLDVRHTLVRELPNELVLLPKLAHLYFGQCRSPRAVNLPAGMDQLKSVKVLGTIDSRELSESVVQEIGELTGLKEIEVVFHDQPVYRDHNHKLLSSIGKCENLEFLIIHGDYNPSNELPLCPFFPLLERLKIAGRFVQVPRWIAQLSSLKKLYVRVCKLDQDDLMILGGLPALGILAVALICIPRKKAVTITSMLHSSTCTDLYPLEETCPAGFTSLEVFYFDCDLPWITFEQGAMPRLKHLHIMLYDSPAGKFPSGIINLHSLEKIFLRYSSHHEGNSDVAETVAAVRCEASMHDNLIKLSVNGNNEVFLSNTRVDETITGTEIEEASNHGNLMEISCIGDHEVLLSNTSANGTNTGTETEEASNHGTLMELPVDGEHEVLMSNTRVDETIADTEIKECY